MPILFAAGSLDSGFVEDTRAMYKAAKRSVGRKLLIVESSGHGVDLVSGTGQATIEAFLKKYATG